LSKEALGLPSWLPAGGFCVFSCMPCLPILYLHVFLYVFTF
jgi:hypothetical protein